MSYYWISTLTHLEHVGLRLHELGPCAAQRSLRDGGWAGGRAAEQVGV